MGGPPWASAPLIAPDNGQIRDKWIGVNGVKKWWEMMGVLCRKNDGKRLGNDRETTENGWEMIGKRLGNGWEMIEKRLGNGWEMIGKRLGNEISNKWIGVNGVKNYGKLSRKNDGKRLGNDWERMRNGWEMIERRRKTIDKRWKNNEKRLINDRQTIGNPSANDRQTMWSISKINQPKNTQNQSKPTQNHPKIGPKTLKKTLKKRSKNPQKRSKTPQNPLKNAFFRMSTIWSISQINQPKNTQNQSKPTQNQSKPTQNHPKNGPKTSKKSSKPLKNPSKTLKNALFRMSPGSPLEPPAQNFGLDNAAAGREKGLGKDKDRCGAVLDTARASRRKLAPERPKFARGGEFGVGGCGKIKENDGFGSFFFWFFWATWSIKNKKK
jgi:hypothetical protein